MECVLVSVTVWVGRHWYANCATRFRDAYNEQYKMSSSYQSPDELNEAKFENAVLYMLNACPDGGQTKLLKLLCVADWTHYRNHLASITNGRYVALKRGPVLDNYKEHFDRLERRGVISRRDVPSGKDKPQISYIPLQVVNHTVFSETEHKTLAEAIACHGDKTGVDLSDMLHDENGVWSWAWNPEDPGRPIPYALVRWMDNWCDDKDIEEARDLLENQGIKETLQSLERCA